MSASIVSLANIGWLRLMLANARYSLPMKPSFVAIPGRTVTNMLLAAGVKAVHWGIGSPPIVAPNYYGVDIEAIDELAFWQAWKRLSAQQQKQSLLFKDIEPHVLQSVESRIAAAINATTVTYLPFYRLSSLLPRGSEGVDLSPFTFEMPTSAGQSRANRDLHSLVADYQSAA
ncbi:hypothetical protein [Bradyrhizobium sp. USDA 3364]